MPVSPNLKNPAVAQAFGQHLRQLRETRDWSQQALADVADVSKQTIYRIENGRTSPTLDLVASLAHGLEISLSELLNFPVMEGQTTHHPGSWTRS